MHIAVDKAHRHSLVLLGHDMSTDTRHKWTKNASSTRNLSWLFGFRDVDTKHVAWNSQSFTGYGGLSLKLPMHLTRLYTRVTTS